jgi:HD superfamily phosphohydrolase YqeK
LLHDIAKELSKEESVKIVSESAEITEEDLLSPPAIHAFCAPIVIRLDFPEYSTGDIISSAFKHTTGGEDMSLFDLIIFLSDYIEEGRRYTECTELRDKLLMALEGAEKNEAQTLIHRAALSELQSTVSHLKEIGKNLNPRTLLAIDTLINKGYTAL